MRGEILTPSEMFPEDLHEAMTTRALCNLGRGHIKWLRQAAKPCAGEGRLQIGARAELARRERLEVGS